MTAKGSSGAHDHAIIAPLNLAHKNPIDTAQLWWYDQAWGPLTIQWFQFLDGRGEQIWRLLKNSQNLTATRPQGLKLGPSIDWICDLLVATGEVDEQEVERPEGRSRGSVFYTHLRENERPRGGDIVEDFRLSLRRSMIESLLLSSLVFTEKDWEVLHAQKAAKKWGKSISYSMPDDDFLQNPSLFSLACEAEPGLGVSPGRWVLGRIQTAQAGEPDYRRLKTVARNPGVPPEILQELHDELTALLVSDLDWLEPILQQLEIAEAEAGEDATHVQRWMDETLDANETAKLQFCFDLSEIVAAILSNPNYGGNQEFLPRLTTQVSSLLDIASSPTLKKPAEPAVKYFAPADGVLRVRERSNNKTGGEYMKHGAVEALWWQLFEAEKAETIQAVKSLLRHHISLPEKGIQPEGQDEELVIVGCLFEAVLAEASIDLGVEDVPFEWFLEAL